MLTGDAPPGNRTMVDNQQRDSHQYTRRYEHPHNGYGGGHSDMNNFQRPTRANNAVAGGSGYPRTSPVKKNQKQVIFQLIDDHDSRIQARLPMRVIISPHDTTESIIMTVKNFYGLYEYGVSFESKEGISIIAAYDNFDNDMVIHVRGVKPPPVVQQERAHTTSPKKPTLGAPFEMRASSHAHSPAKTTRTGTRSMSPRSEYGRRSVSAAPGGKARKPKSKDAVAGAENDGYSSDDGGNGSVTSSRRSKTELVNAEISVDNIVEGGRRKRAFESSELPLFVPPQVPMSASISSLSPQRRGGPGQMASPYAHNNQQTFSYTQPLPSPQSHGSAQFAHPGAPANGYGQFAAPPRQLRGGRPSATYYPPARYSGSGIMPTPDPTNGSVISDEDVAIQLMRLGNASNFSSHGRTSTSTVDDALSGKAEAASSDEEDEEDDIENSSERAGLPAVPRWPKNDVGPARKKQRVKTELHSDNTSGEDYEDHRDASFKGDSDEVMPDASTQRRTSKSKPKPRLPSLPTSTGDAMARPRSMSMAKPKPRPLTTALHSHTFSPSAKVPMSPASMPSQSRKPSLASASTITFSHSLLNPDEDDLSSKPRCQRCRKSKKGCDRQRPCGRCKDAGIGHEGCVSEDEGNGRRGRYGRHMGVGVKKGEDGSVEGMSMDGNEGMGSVNGGMMGTMAGPANGALFLAPAQGAMGGKKRKR
nr:hypothetical protein B0A51_08077 [Rachicladosporium sp. CCFEE 5018]